MTPQQETEQAAEALRSEFLAAVKILDRLDPKGVLDTNARKKKLDAALQGFCNLLRNVGRKS